MTLRPGGGKIDPQGNSFNFPALIGGPGMLRIGATASSSLNGTVTLSGVNTYTGGTVIEGPHTLQVSAAGNLGSPGGSLSFSNALGRGFGTFNLNGADVTVGNLNGSGGTIRNNKSGTNNVFTIGTGDASGGGFEGTILDGSGSLWLVKTGAGTITLTATNTWSGGTRIAGGVLQLGAGVTRNGGLAGNVTNQATLIIANPLPQIFANVVSGSGALTKTGAGRLTLTSANTYAGKTTISAGTLELTDFADISSSAAVDVSFGATLDVASRGDCKFVLPHSRGLTGGGTIAGSLEALAGSIVLPGSGIGALTISERAMLAGTVMLELNRGTLPNCDQLNVAGSIAASGTLTVTNLGAALQVGDSFQLFNKAVTGFAVVNLPPLAPGLAWQNHLAQNGSLAVVAVVSSTPVDLALQFGGGAMTLSWPEDRVGWRLQVLTNGPGAGLSATWFDVPGATVTNAMTLPVDPANGSVFFRLVYP